MWSAAMDSSLSPALELAEANAWHDVFAAAPSDLAERVGLRSERLGSATLLAMPGVPHPWFNRVIGLGVGEPATEEILDRALSIFGEAGVASFWLAASPTAQPAELPEWMLSRGLHPLGNWAKVYRGRDSMGAIVTELAVVEATTPSLAAAFSSVVRRSFGLPAVVGPLFEALVGRAGWRVFLALENGVPVAAGAVLVQGEVAWLGIDATLPSRRRQGGQGAIMRERVRASIGAGCAWMVGEVEESLPERPDPSHHNTIRNGFQIAYLRPNYGPRPAAAEPTPGA
jgi:hypothetical protein